MNKNSTPTETGKKKQTIVTFNCFLNTETLRIEKITSKFDVIYEKKTNIVILKKLTDKTVETMSFDLIEITKEELIGFKKTSIPSFVLKEEERYYYSAIPDNINLISSGIFQHKCAASGKECNRLSAASDEKGGCAKVRDRSNKGIEKYPWIIEGYETFNTRYDSFVVAECLHYEKCPPRKK